MKKFMNYKFNCLYAFKRSSLLLHSYAFNPYAVKFYSDSHLLFNCYSFIKQQDISQLDSLFVFNDKKHPKIIIKDSFLKNLCWLEGEDRDRVLKIIDVISDDVLFLIVVRCFIIKLSNSSEDLLFVLKEIAPVFNKARKPVIDALIKLGIDENIFKELLAPINIQGFEGVNVLSAPSVSVDNVRDPLIKIYLDLYKSLVERLYGRIEGPMPEHPNIMRSCWKYAQFYKFIVDNPLPCKMFGWSVDWNINYSLITSFITGWLGSSKSEVKRKGVSIRKIYSSSVDRGIYFCLYQVIDQLNSLFSRSEGNVEEIIYLNSRFVESAFKHISIKEIFDVIKIREGKNRGDKVNLFNRDSVINSNIPGFNPQMDRVNLLIDVIVESKNIPTLAYKSDVMDVESIFMTSAYKIINNPNLLNKEKEICIEILALYYENNFVVEVIKSLGKVDESNNSKIHHLLVSLFTRSYSTLSTKVEILIKKHTTKKFLDKLSNQCSSPSSPTSIDRKIKLIIILNCLGVDRVCNIVFNVAIKLCGMKGGAEEMDLINNISTSLIDHMHTIKEKDLGHINPNLRSYYLNNKDVILITSSADQVEIGQGLLDILLDCYDDLFNKQSELKIKDSQKYRVNYVFIREKYVAFLANFVFNPLRLPMVCPPIKYYSLDDSTGGYLYDPYNRIVNKSLVHQNPLNKMVSRIDKLQIYTVNYLNCQGFVINIDMLDFLSAEWKKDNSLIFGVYNKPFQEESKGKASKEDIQKHNSLYWMYRNILNIAKLYQNHVIYFPTFLDFRGRVYPLVNYLNYQGGDIARSLLLFMDNQNFVEKDPNNIDYLYIYLSDVFGGNKLSRGSRISWAMNNLESMYNLYLEDRSSFEEIYLAKAKEKAQFMSCFLGLAKLKFGRGLDINVPVLFDASCSGMQHLSSLTTDISLASMVNIISGDKPADFYATCAVRVREWIENIDDKMVRDKLLLLKLDRKLMKIPVMTIPYNIGLEGLTEKITDNYEKYYVEKVEQGEKVKKLMFKVDGEFTLNGEVLHLTGREAGKLGSIVYTVVNSMMPPIQALKQYFHKMITILKYINKPMFWITPAGMKVWASERFTNVKRVKTTILKSSKPVTVHIPTDNYDYKTIERGLMANFIHSLDAANIHILVGLILQDRGWDRRLNLYTIHDCFASTNNEMPLIEMYVKSAFASLYFNNNYLKELHNSLISQIKSYADLNYIRKEEGVTIYNMVMGSESWEVELPDLPDIKWDDNKEFFKQKIMESEYFIS